MAAVHVPLAQGRSQTSQEALGSYPLGSHDFDFELLDWPRAARPPHQHGKTLVAIAYQVEAALNTRQHAILIEGDVHVLDRSFASTGPPQQGRAGRRYQI